MAGLERDGENCEKNDLKVLNLRREDCKDRDIWRVSIRCPTAAEPAPVSLPSGDTGVGGPKTCLTTSTTSLLFQSAKI